MRGPNQRRHHHHPPPPTPTSTFNPWAHQFPPPKTRDSDASYASSLPPNDTRSALSTINHYITTTLSLPPIKTPLYTKDTILFNHLLQHLGLREDDIFICLKALNCPVKIKKSTLLAPGEKRASEMLVCALVWLVQICQYNDNLLRKSEDEPFMADNGMFVYVRKCYGFYMEGEDGSVTALDEELIGKVEAQKDVIREENRALEGEIREMEERVEGFKSRPSRVEELDKEEKVLEEEIKKVRAKIEQFTNDVDGREKSVKGKEKELEDKVVANKEICDGNRKIEKQVQGQSIDIGEAERMKRELRSLDQDIKATEQARSDKEEQVYNINAGVGEKLRELEEGMMKCNQAVRRLKLGSEFQYKLNAEGSTPAELLGIDYKTTLKPTLAASLEDAKRAYAEKKDEVTGREKQATELASKIEAKKDCISTLAAQIKKVEAERDKIKEETQGRISKCSADAQNIAKELAAETSNMVIAESNAADSLKVLQAKLQEAITETEEKVQLCARNLFSVIDSVSKFKEHVALKISEMETDLSETSVKVADGHKYSVPVMFQHVEDKCVLME